MGSPGEDKKIKGMTGTAQAVVMWIIEQRENYLH